MSVDTGEHKDLRLGYAQHVYKAQGLTVDRAHAMIGGWQTDRERAYVAVSRSREKTEIYTAREDLGEQGMDTGAIERLGEAIAESHAQQPSIATPAAERDQGQDTGERLPAPAPATTRGAGHHWPTRRASASEDREQEQTAEPESEVARIMRESQEQRDREREQEHDLGYGIE